MQHKLLSIKDFIDRYRFVYLSLSISWRADFNPWSLTQTASTNGSIQSLLRGMRGRNGLFVITCTVIAVASALIAFLWKIETYITISFTCHCARGACECMHSDILAPFHSPICPILLAMRSMENLLKPMWNKLPAIKGKNQFTIYTIALDARYHFSAVRAPVYACSCASTDRNIWIYN